MGYALSIGSITVFESDPIDLNIDCCCDEAQAGCTPSFVYSIPGQVDFRSSLHHLIKCNKRNCSHLRVSVFKGMRNKLRWLMDEHSLLGCIHVQPLLYGARGVSFKRKDFPQVSKHLAHCPKESCAQLRRALLLTIREEIRSD